MKIKLKIEIEIKIEMKRYRDTWLARCEPACGISVTCVTVTVQYLSVAAFICFCSARRHLSSAVHRPQAAGEKIARGKMSDDESAHTQVLSAPRNGTKLPSKLVQAIACNLAIVGTDTLGVSRGWCARASRLLCWLLWG